MSNFQIIEKCRELQIKNVKGVFMRDETRTMKKKVMKNECLVINIDHSSNDGTHWTCLFIKNYASFYFDSYGFEPTLEIREYCDARFVSNRYYS